MKIAIISLWNISENSIGGTERFVYDLAVHLRKDGDIADVYTFIGEDNKLLDINIFSLKDALANTFELPENANMDEYLLQSIMHDMAFENVADKIASVVTPYFNNKEYDIFIINTFLLVNSLKKFKRIFVIHTNPFEFELQFGLKSYQNMCNIVANSEKINTAFIAPSFFYSKVYSIEFKHRVYTIPHVINLKRLETKDTKEKLRKIFGIPDNKIVILLPSRLEPKQKRPELVLEAIGLMDRKLADKVHVVFSGKDNPYNEYGREIAKKCKIADISFSIVRFDAMNEAYALCDSVILPSCSESFGYSLLEALSLKIPTFASDIPTYREIAVEYSGLCKFFNNVEELSSDLERFISYFPVQVSNDITEWLKKYDTKLWIQRYRRIINEIL